MRSTFLLLAILGGIFNTPGALQKTDPDEAVLAQLRKAGSNLSKYHKIEFFLYFPKETIAKEAGQRIKQAGFDVEVRRAAKGPDWLCFATRTMVPELAALQRIRRKFNAIAASLGGEYDGWGTGVVK
jgi:hypothetical protein